MTHAKWLASFLAVCALVACGADGLSSLDGAPGKTDSESGEDRGSSGDPALGPNLGPTDNGIILLHAARMPAFRVCFEGQPKLRPLPDAELMPQANVVGVEVGSAVRIAPFEASSPKTGTIKIFNEAFIRSLYPRDQATAGPDCEALLDVPAYATAATTLEGVEADLSTGVHLLVLTGCPASVDGGVTYTKEECGPDYEGTSTFKMTEQTLTGRQRTDPGNLPAEVIHLSRGVEAMRAGKSLVVSFGELGSGAAHDSKAEDPPFAGAPVVFASEPRFDPNDVSVYAKVGFRVSLGPDALLEQSLADVQSLSAPRDIPTRYYAAASNYVLLLVGDPIADDAGADPRAGLHLLAVPVVSPKEDAGAEAGAPDGG